MNRNCVCSHCCSRATNRCCDYRSTENCCAEFISIEEILTWICIGSLIVFFYKTIKFCLIIGGILLMLYWICQYTDIPRWLKEWMGKRAQSKSENTEQLSEEDEELETPIKEKKQENLSTRSLFNPSI